MGFQKGNNYGTKSKRGKSKINQELKDKLADLSSEILDSLDITTLSNSERLKVLQISTSYVLPKLKSIATNIEDDYPTDFHIHIIDDAGKVDKILKLVEKE